MNLQPINLATIISIIFLINFNNNNYVAVVGEKVKKNKTDHEGAVNSRKDFDFNYYKNRVKDMFYHAYNSYIYKAYPYDELRPITCNGFDTWGSYSLTLIDSLDMLIILGNQTEFDRVVNLLIKNLKFDKDINVSVFETNIRVIGGLLSAHLLSYRFYIESNSNYVDLGNRLADNWPCDGPLLKLAVQIADKIMPAFNSTTGMPYGTVNLLNGVPKGETPETCVAGIGTFLIEFATLSRLTGDPKYETAAIRALDSLWDLKSALNLPGNHLNVETGKWTGIDATIGSGVDSYFEYLVKGGIMLNKPELVQQFLTYQRSIARFLSHDNWYFWANMNKGQKTMALFSSLEAFYPGLLTLVGNIDDAIKSVINYHQIWRRFGSLPEFLNIQTNEVHSNRDSYPLRPELIESLMYIIRATKHDKQYFEMAIDYLEAIETIAKLDCGFATVKDVKDHRLENRMESFFLAETLKYLYLIFDKDSFLHNDISNNSFKLIKNAQGSECKLETGFFFFNTEAHPIDGAALDCCIRLRNRSDKNNDDFSNLNFDSLIDIYTKLSSGIESENLDGGQMSLMRQEINNLIDKNIFEEDERKDKLDEFCENLKSNPLSNEVNNWKETKLWGHEYSMTCSLNNSFNVDVSHLNNFNYYP